MSTKEKLIKRVFDGQCITFAEAEKLLTSIGYVSEYPQGGSSHKTFRKSGCDKITLVATQKPLKKYAMKMIKEALVQERLQYD